MSNIETIQDAINHLVEVSKQMQNIKTATHTLLQQYAEENRKFQRGEKVNIFNYHTNEFVGIGMVANVRTTIFLDIIHTTPKNVADEMNLQYEIFAVKKDGTQSNKHYFAQPNYIAESSKHQDYYITKIE